MNNAARMAMAEAFGYTEPKIMPDGTLAALGKQMYTTGIVVGIDEDGYAGRFCYTSHAVAATALREWDGIGDPPGPWIKYKGDGGERLGPGAVGAGGRMKTRPAE